jgi:hypothetical protein
LGARNDDRARLWRTLRSNRNQGHQIGICDFDQEFAAIATRYAIGE